jgi:hypothetical protein
VAAVSRYAAALRDLATGRVRAHDRRLRGFDGPGWERYGELLTSAFLLAVDRRFRAGQDRAPVIRFVASVRERYDHTGHDVDPATAEALVWAALGERAPLPMDRATVAAQTLLVIGLLDDEGMSRAELAAFLREADAISERAQPGEQRQCARAEGGGEEADQEPNPGVAGRCADHDPGRTPDREHQVASEQRQRRQPGERPGDEGEQVLPRGAEAEEQAVRQDDRDQSAAGVHGGGPAQR